MKIKKKTIIITAAGLTALGVGGWYLAQNLRSSQVDVYPVSELSQSIWQSGTSLEQVDHVVCHQANSRIIDHVVKKLGAPADKFYKNMHRYGNTSAASIPLALDEMLESGAIRPGQTVACVGFGAGLTWGAVLLRF